MLKIAITGNIASGKSTVEKLLKEKSYKVLDADEVAHELMKNKEVKLQLISAFHGFDIIENNEISRPKLGKLVFTNDDLRKKLESILHPLIKKEINHFFDSQKGGKITFVSIPLLFEANFDKLFDKIILIYADDEIRLTRLIKRNNLPIEHAKNRIKIQMDQEQKVNLSDYVIKNNGTLPNLIKKLEEVLELL